MSQSPDFEDGLGLKTRAEAPHPLIDARHRFLSFLEEEGECLVWTGSLNRDGYGQFRVSAFRTSPIPTHVVSYLLFVGDIAFGEQVHHRCENRACCRPHHLEAKPRSLHIAEHNRTKRKAKANWSNRIIEVKQEVRDGRIYTVNVLRSIEPRRPGRARHTSAVPV